MGKQHRWKKRKHATLAGDFYELTPASGQWTDAELLEFLSRGDAPSKKKQVAIENVYCHFGPEVTRLAGFDHLSSLRQLDVAAADGLRTLGGLEACSQLELVWLTKNTLLEDLEPLRAVSSLREFHAQGSNKLSNISALRTHTALRDLAIGELEHAKPDPEMLASLVELERLSIREWPTLVDFSWVTGCKKLRLIDASFCRNLRDISALAELPELKSLLLYGLDPSTLRGVDRLGDGIIES